MADLCEPTHTNVITASPVSRPVGGYEFRPVR